MLKKTLSFFLLLSFFIHGQTQAAIETTVDYIVVGVGTAGAVMAKRLSDDKETSVIAIHDGPNLTNDPLIKYSRYRLVTVLSMLLDQTFNLNLENIFVPQPFQRRFHKFARLQPKSDLQLYETGLTTQQTSALNRMLPWGIALPVGGASAVNAGAWCRGTDQVYAQWEAIAGPEWSVARILATYKELEKYEGVTTNPAARGYQGPLTIQMDPAPSGVAYKFTDAEIYATGYPFVLDYNDPSTPIGVSLQMQITEKGHDGKYRVSSATAFLNDRVMKSNGHGVGNRKLNVLFNTFARKVIWSGNTAVGVECEQCGKIHHLFARKGVIVCAGLRSSPFLLYSGVGSSALLNSLGIPVIYDNPNVGQQLADQPHLPLFWTADPDDFENKGFETLFTQIAWLPAVGGNPGIRQIRIASLNPIPGLVATLVDLCQPLSRGYVTINSANPIAPPVVNLEVLSSAQDLTDYQNALMVYVKNIDIQLRARNPGYGLIYPDPAILNNIGLVTSFIQNGVGCNQHFQSHCRMAPEVDGGVVDSTGKVYGVNNLYVADNSIVPQCMDGSPMATAFMIASNVARLLGY